MARACDYELLKDNEAVNIPMSSTDPTWEKNFKIKGWQGNPILVLSVKGLTFNAEEDVPIIINDHLTTPAGYIQRCKEEDGKDWITQWSKIPKELLKDGADQQIQISAIQDVSKKQYLTFQLKDIFLFYHKTV